MDKVIFTPRLKLTLVEKADRGSPEFEWIHEMRSNKEAMFWGITPMSKTPEDTEEAIKNVYLPTSIEEGKHHRVVYAVHEILEPKNGPSHNGDPTPSREKTTQFLGIIRLHCLKEDSLEIPEHLSIPAADASTTLVIELAYAFLPRSWGKGYATEAVTAVLEAGKRGAEFWKPYEKVYVRGIVNDENLPSQKVMEKSGMPKRGVLILENRPVFVGGKMSDTHVLPIYGLHLLP